MHLFTCITTHCTLLGSLIPRPSHIFQCAESQGTRLYSRAHPGVGMILGLSILAVADLFTKHLEHTSLCSFPVDLTMGVCIALDYFSKGPSLWLALSRESWSRFEHYIDIQSSASTPDLFTDISNV